MKTYILRPEKVELYLGEHVGHVPCTGDILEVRTCTGEVIASGVVTGRRWVFGEPRSGVEDRVLVSIRDFDESDHAFRDFDVQP